MQLDMNTPYPRGLGDIQMSVSRGHIILDLTAAQRFTSKRNHQVRFAGNSDDDLTCLNALPEPDNLLPAKAHLGFLQLLQWLHAKCGIASSRVHGGVA